jgi:Tol biopolymer transport system component
MGKRKPRDVPSWRWSRVGRIGVYEPKGFRRMMSVGALVLDASFSPDGSKIAFLEVEKDEYGDYELHTLKVADIRSQRVTVLAKNRRLISYLWAGSGRLAVAAQDKYSVSALSLVDVATGNWTVLVKDRDVTNLRPLAWVASKGLVAYCTSSGGATYPVSEIWSVRPGIKPVRLFPKAGGANNAKR